MWLAATVFQICTHRTSQVAQGLRIRQPMQGTWVPSLAREDFTCPGATKHKHHNYWAQCCSLCSAPREATAMRSLRTNLDSSPHSPRLETAHMQQQRPSVAKIKIKIFFKNMHSSSLCTIKQFWFFNRFIFYCFIKQLKYLKHIFFLILFYF